MIFAIDGADFGDDELGAYSSSVASLQTALITLGQKVGDSTLKALMLDGLIGPKTTAATNRAFAMYITNAPANFATGTLSQSQVSTNASSLASYVTAEISRRGGTASSTTAPVRVPAVATPTALSPYSPSAAPVVSDTSAQIVKWAAIGLGGVVVASVLYMIWRSRQGRPAFGGCDLGTAGINDHIRRQWVDNDEGLYRLYQQQSYPLVQFVKKNRAKIDAVIRRARGSLGLGALPSNEADALERMMDRSGGVSDVFDTIGEIAGGKAEHVRENWQDERLARRWNGLARKMGRLATATRDFEVK